MNDKINRTEHLSAQRYFIINGEQCNKSDFKFKKNDSLIQLKNKKDDEYLIKLAFLYSNPAYSQIIFNFNETEYSNEAILELKDLAKNAIKPVYHKSLIAVKREYVLDNDFKVEIKSNLVDDNFFTLAENIGKAYQGIPVSFDVFSKALLEILPENIIELDLSFNQIRADFKELINNHNIINKNNGKDFKVYYNTLNESKKTILFFNYDPNINSYSFVLRSLDGYVVYILT